MQPDERRRSENRSRKIGKLFPEEKKRKDGTTEDTEKTIVPERKEG